MQRLLTMSSRQNKLKLGSFVFLAMQSMLAESAEVEEVEIIGRSVNLVGFASSASEGRVSHEELQQRPLLRTGEVLEVVPGLVATQHSGSGKANQFFLRGFNLDHGTDFATFVDGMPVNMRSHGHGQGYTDLNFLIPELVEEITYRKGSYYADAGDFSGAGSSLIRTAEHVDEPGLSFGLGQYGFQRFLLNGSADNELGDFIYAAEFQGYEGPWDNIDEDVAKINLLLKQRWESGDDSFELGFMAYDNSWNSADQIPDRAVRSGLISQFGSIDPTVGGESSRYSLSANGLKQFERGALSYSAYVISYDMNLFSNFTYFIDPAGDQFRQVDDRRIYGGNLQWSQESQLGRIPVKNRVGLSYRLDDIDRVGLVSTRQRNYLADIRLDAVKEWSTGLFWESELHWTPKLRTVAGLRYDYFDFSVTPLAAADASSLAANGGSADDDNVNLSFNLIYALNQSYELYASIGEGFHSNDARGTTIQLDPLDGSPVEPVDPLVKTLGSEIGVRAFLTDRLNASAALWHLDIDSELLFVGDAGNTEDTGVGTERTGLELTAYYQLNPSWGIDLEYSWTDAHFTEIVDGSDEVPGSLSDVFSGGVNFQLNDQFNAYLRLRHFGDYPLDGGQKADSSTMLNLRLGYAFNERLDITIDLLNMLDSNDHDVEYFYESRLPGEAVPVEDHHYHVFEPRVVRAYLNFNF